MELLPSVFQIHWTHTNVNEALMISSFLLRFDSILLRKWLKFCHLNSSLENTRAHPECLCLCLSQERQRLETILSLCSELGRAEVHVGGTAASPPSAVADLQKINHELQKLQVNDDSDDDGLSVFSDSLTVNGTRGKRRQASEGSENGYHDELQARHRRSSGHQSPAVTLRNFAPSPSSHSQRTHEVRKLLSHRFRTFFFFLKSTRL